MPLGVHAVKQGNGFSLWASAARKWDEMPRRIHLTGTDANALAKDAVLRLQGPLERSRILITRAVEADALMTRVLRAHGLSIAGATLFTPEGINFEMPEDVDRLFFTSRNAVRYFVQGVGSLSIAPCDAIGSGTAEEIRAHGAEVVFIGDGPDTPTIAEEYVMRFGTQRVLFPCATQGQRTVQRAMPEGNATDVHVYRMRPIGDVDVPDADIAILTSPDNASALHAIRKLDTFVHLIAMGTSTAQRIQDISGADAVIPWASNEMALLDAVFGLATLTS